VRVKISIVIPVFNEAAGIELLLQRVVKVASQLSNHEWEIVFVDDGSSDETVEIISRHRHLFHGTLTIVEFSRNFGHQLALLAGLQRSKGDVIFCIDADLQDPPELFSAMLEKHAEGFDVVYAVRKTRAESWPKRCAYKLFYRLMACLTEVPLPMDAGDFGLVTRRVVEVMINSADKDLFLRGLRGWSGFRQIGYEYDRPARAIGEAKYSFIKLLQLALSGLVGFSSLPLKFATGVGMVSVSGCIVYGAYALVEKIFGGSTPAGWTSTVLLILFLGGAQLLSIGILGEYIGRIYKQLQSRPLFVVKKRPCWNNR
jgi:dolichol-phosphate mannosyltransferase